MQYCSKSMLHAACFRAACRRQACQGNWPQPALAERRAIPADGKPAGHKLGSGQAGVTQQLKDPARCCAYNKSHVQPGQA